MKEVLVKTEELKKRIQNGEKLDAILPEAFALVCEASRRVMNMDPFPVQIVGGGEQAAVILPGKLPRRLALAGNAARGKEALHRRVDGVAVLLAAGAGGCRLKLGPAAGFGRQVLEDKLRHGAAADVAQADKQDAGHAGPSVQNQKSKLHVL